MTHVAYNKETTVLLKSNTYYATKGAAKAAITRAANAGKIDAADYAVADTNLFFNFVEKSITKQNLLSGKDYDERANTPLSCSPSSETYWSM
jgi:hypothetical protein